MMIDEPIHKILKGSIQCLNAVNAALEIENIIDIILVSIYLFNIKL